MNDNGDREIKIIREDVDDDDEHVPSRFPRPPIDALSKTESSDYKNDSEGSTTKKKSAGKWDKVKQAVAEVEVDETDLSGEREAKSRWSNAARAFKKAPQSARSFLGIDNEAAHNGGGVGAHNTKTLNNWNERTFRVLKNNRVFGGKLKNNAVETYLNELRPEHADEADPFIFYRITGGNHSKLPSKKSVVNMVTHGISRMISKPKASEDTGMTQMEPEPASRMLRSIGPEVVAREDSDPNADNEEGCWDAFKCTGDRKPGVGFCGKFFDTYIDSSKKDEYNQIIKEVPQHRPYFTYWITFVQIVICLVSLIAYGLAPIGFSYHMKKGLVISTTLEKQLISFPVKENFWIGPAAMDLVHLGAKYAPCMRNDSNIFKAIIRDQLREKETACCVRNDKGGCVQTSKNDCPELLSYWHKWNSGLPELESNRTSGSVCGLNPDYCNDGTDKKWPDDITKWPICSNPTRPDDDSKAEHMHCEVIGRPCCVGIQGECLITTKEHCSLMRGYFHDNANLCAQVDCMQDVCGMIDFLNPKSPDQVYRLFTSIFIHAGIIQLAITIVFNIFILRDLEKLAGCLRIAIIYIGSGIIGNLGSAIFLPYQAEVGPSGSQFGILACLFIELFHIWGYYASPWQAFLRLFGTLLFFFAVGFLPMIDNYANIFGFISGLLISTILFPNVNLKGVCRRILIIGVCIGGILVLATGLIIIFYVKPISQCDACKFFSCPFGKKYCLDMDFNITRLTQK